MNSQYGFYQEKEVVIEEYSDAGANDRFPENDNGADAQRSQLFSYCNDLPPEGLGDPNLR